MNTKSKLLHAHDLIRWNVFLGDQTDQQTPKPEVTCYDLNEAKDAKEKFSWLGLNVEVKAETLPQFIGGKSKLDRLICLHKSARETIEADMLKAEFSREDFVTANKRAKAFGLNYGRTIAFTTNDPWADWPMIDHFSRQFLYTQGFLCFLEFLAETYAEQAFWQARIKKYKHQYEATRKAVHLCGYAIASVILGATQCNVSFSIDYSSSFDDPVFQGSCSAEIPTPKGECIAKFSGLIAKEIYFNTNASESDVIELIESELCMESHAPGPWLFADSTKNVTLKDFRENRHFFSDAFKIILDNFHFVKAAAEKLIEWEFLDLNEINWIIEDYLPESDDKQDGQ